MANKRPDCEVNSRVNLNAEHVFPLALIAHANVTARTCARSSALIPCVWCHLWLPTLDLSPAQPLGQHSTSGKWRLWGTLSCLGCRPVFWVSGLLSPAFPQASVPRVKLQMVFVAEMASIFVCCVYRPFVTVIFVFSWSYFL